MIPSGTQFIGFSDSVNLTERRSASVNAETAPYTIEDIKGYKVYTALLTQRGGDGMTSIGAGDLTIGVTYQIIDNAGSGWDFTNVGAPNNDIDTYFVATGTTPNSWGIDGQLDYNTGAPVVTVLENTIGNVWFTYDDLGNYAARSSNLFLDNKTTVSLSPNSYIESPTDIHSIDVLWRDGFEDTINISTYFNYELADEQLNYGGNAFIEIRVYN
jgi:hypothetical protein